MFKLEAHFTDTKFPKKMDFLLHQSIFLRDKIYADNTYYTREMFKNAENLSTHNFL